LSQDFLPQPWTEFIVPVVIPFPNLIKKPTVSIWGKEYYGVTGFLDATIDMALVDVDPCPKVALGLKEPEERSENGDEPTKA